MPCCGTIDNEKCRLGIAGKFRDRSSASAIGGKVVLGLVSLGRYVRRVSYSQPLASSGLQTNRPSAAG